MEPENGLVTEEIVEEIIEIEIFVKEGRAIPRAKGYVIRVDKQKIVVHQHEISGRRFWNSPTRYHQKTIFCARYSLVEDRKSSAWTKS